jgi:Z1 domain
MSPKFYQMLAETRGDLPDLQQCVANTVNNLVKLDTSVGRPGMLLGKIQSGKTRAFLGVIASAFDQGYDMAVVLTKGTVSLAKQTFNRIRKDFKPFIEADEVQVYDIMTLPENLTTYELSQKMILIVKKEDDNLNRLIKAVEEVYPELQQRRLLIVDDEADFASLSYRRKAGTVSLGVVSGQIEELRKLIPNSDFLQVTATPYSLYLQPDEEVTVKGTALFRPKRPSFTEILPTHSTYVGGEYYFDESGAPSSPAYYVYQQVPLDEREALKKEDGRRLKLQDVLMAKNTAVLRRAITNFVMGAAILRLYQKADGQVPRKYAFLFHTEQSRESHAWQEQVASAIRDQLISQAKLDSGALRDTLRESYDDLKRSVEAGCLKMPSLDECVQVVGKALVEGQLMITRVNSDKEIEELLDDSGQLRLRTPMNMFIGGQILDRGLTIDNMIGFYYGRNPKKFQQDTVLQHSRMYGARPKQDLTVTRFYAPLHIYQMLGKIHEFDAALREAFRSGSHDRGVYFIQRDAAERLVPCSPNKLMFSELTAIRPGKRLLPIGFQTVAKSNGKANLKKLDDAIRQILGGTLDGTAKIEVDTAVKLLEFAYSNLEFEHEGDDERKALIAALEHLSKTASEPSARGRVFLMAASNRDVARFREGGRPSNAPDTKQQADFAEQNAQEMPALMLLRQNGTEKQGWRGLPFWWPVIVPQQSAVTSVFAAEAPADEAVSAAAAGVPLSVPAVGSQKEIA